MVSSAAATVSEYLGELPAERRAVIAKVRALVRKSLPKGYEERMNWGMICWQVPLKRKPDTYNGQPICYVALAAQKNNYALYLTGLYMDRKHAAALRAARGKSGKKLDMGKSCLRFKALDDLPAEAIGASIASIPVEECIRLHETLHPGKK